jgi:hypothetical protein
MTDKTHPPARRLAIRPESLETRELLSLLINAKPTLEVHPTPPSVRRAHNGAFSIVQPANIHVFGTAQPPIGFNTTIDIFAEDRTGQIVNGGLPLATATPDQLGRYSATVSLPSTIRKDVNFLVAFETVTGSITSNLTINPTTLSGLNSNLAINGTTLVNFNGQLTINAGTLSNLAATIANPNGTISNLSGPITIAAGTTVGGITGSVVTPAGTTLTLTNGTITTTGGTLSALTGTLTVPAGTTVTIGAQTGTIGAIDGNIALLGGSISGTTGTLTGQSGTLGASTGTFTQTGSGTLGAQTGALTGATGTIGATTSTLTETGTAIESGRTGVETNGTGTINPTTGTSTQVGTATIAGTTGTAVTPVTEHAVSDPVEILVHVPPRLVGLTPLVGATSAHRARPAHVHVTEAVPRAPAHTFRK